MEVEFPGTGGAMPIPRARCACGVCVEARARGAPYARGGPSVVHGPTSEADATFEETIAIVATLGARRTPVMHVEGVRPVGREELTAIAEAIRDRGVAIEFAYDTLVVAV